MSDRKTPAGLNIGTAPAKSEPDAAYAPLLERRVREETEGYEFGSLLAGVSSREPLEPITPAPAAVPAPPPRKIAPLVLGGGIGIGAIVALASVFAVLQNGGGKTTLNASAVPAAAASPAAPLASASPAAPAAPAAAALRENVGRPDPALTPGRLQPQPRKESPIAPETREKVMRAYGVDPGDVRYTLCRLIPASLGGTEDAQNLFPTTAWFADLKVRLDNTLTDLVARKILTADQARQELTSDWIACAHKYEVRNYGQKDKEAARQVEEKLRW